MIYIDYDCLTMDGSFIIAKLSGWEWSEKEKNPPFKIVYKVPMHEATDDYQVEILPNLWVWASDIGAALIDGGGE